MDILTFDSVTASALRIMASEKIRHYQALSFVQHKPEKLKKHLKPLHKLLSHQMHDAEAFNEAFGGD